VVTIARPDFDSGLDGCEVLQEAGKKEGCDSGKAPDFKYSLPPFGKTIEV
jgi:hypothetical protein